MRFETGPGEQAQVDWGSTAIYLGEERVWIHIFTMVLGYSRRIFARAYRSEGLDSLLDGHEKAFGHFGGRTETILSLRSLRARCLEPRRRGDFTSSRAIIRRPPSQATSVRRRSMPRAPRF